MQYELMERQDEALEEVGQAHTRVAELKVVEELIALLMDTSNKPRRLMASMDEVQAQRLFKTTNFAAVNQLPGAAIALMLKAADAQGWTWDPGINCPSFNAFTFPLRLCAMRAFPPR